MLFAKMRFNKRIILLNVGFFMIKFSLVPFSVIFYGNRRFLNLITLRWIVRVLPFTYMGFIWFLSSRPADAIVNFHVHDSFIKESLHLVEFGILYLLFVLFLLVDGKLTRRANLIVAILSCLWGLIDEIHQAFVPYRSATVIDFVKDAIGVAVGYWIVWRSYFLKKGKLSGLFTKVERWFRPE